LPIPPYPGVYRGAYSEEGFAAFRRLSGALFERAETWVGAVREESASEVGTGGGMLVDVKAPRNKHYNSMYSDLQSLRGTVSPMALEVMEPSPMPKTGFEETVLRRREL
jgi:hypothetical protein